MAMIQMLLWLTLGVLLYVLIGWWLKSRFRRETEQADELDRKQRHAWYVALPTHTGPEYEALAQERREAVGPQQCKSARRAKLWNIARSVAAYITVTVAILAAASWIPGAQEAAYDEGWYASEDAFNAGWADGCELLMATSDGYRWYYGDQEYDQQWCESLNKLDEDQEFWWDYRPRNLGESASIEEYEQMARRAGWLLALRTAFAAQPTLCFGDECWDWDRMETRLMDLAVKSREFGFGY
jgi:hypothetical protein